MKFPSTKFSVFLLFFLLSTLLKAQTWTGAVNSDWNNAGNWDPAQVPDYDGYVIVPGSGVANWPVLSNNLYILFFFLQPGSEIDTKGFSIYVSAISSSYSRDEVTIINGATIKNTKPGTTTRLRVAGLSRIQNSTFEGDVSIQFDGYNTRLFTSALEEGSNHFKGNIRFIETGNSTIYASKTKSTYDGNLLVERELFEPYPVSPYETPSANVYSNLFEGGALIKGNFTYINKAFGSTQIGSETNPVEILGNAEITHHGDLNVSSQISVDGTSVVKMAGTAVSNLNQTGTLPLVFKKLSIEKTGSGMLKLVRPLEISGNLDFKSGMVYAVSNAPIIFLDGATTSGATDASHIVGRAIKVGDDPFTFPVGSETKLIPISISAPSNVTDEFSAQYVSGNPTKYNYNTELKSPSLEKVSSTGSWHLQRLNGTSDVTVSLAYFLGAGAVTEPTKLRVAHWNGSLWEDFGNGGTSGGMVSTSSPVSSFSPFTLATTDAAANPLPVKLIRFSAQAENQTALLQWSTSEETNSDRFDIEHSLDAKSWKKVGEVKALGESKAVFQYSFVHPSPITSQNYYRLKMVDKDNSFAYSKIENLNLTTENKFVLFPNPASNKLFVQTEKGNDVVKIEFYNKAGTRVMIDEKFDGKNGADLSRLPVGLYSVGINFQNGSREIRTILINR